MKLFARTLAALTAVASISACAHTGKQDVSTTDKFLRNALDAYGVVDVIPREALAVPAAPATTAPATSAPMASTDLLRQQQSQQTGRRTYGTVEEACAGRTGIQRSLKDARTGQPIDCGPRSAPSV